MKIYCKDCRKEIVGVVYVDDKVTRCEKCVEKFYKLEKQNAKQNKVGVPKSR